MASATGIPSTAAAARGQTEEEPLLGRRGDASQMQGQPLYHNLWIGMLSHQDRCEGHVANKASGTAPIAQAGIWIVSPPTQARTAPTPY